MKQSISDAAKRHDIHLLELEAMVDHVHLLVESTDDSDLSRAMHLLKGAARRVMQTLPGIRMDAGIDHFWQRRFGAKPVEPEALANVRRYIRTQKERPARYER